MTTLVRGLGAEALTGSCDFFPLCHSCTGVFPDPQQTSICRELGENRAGGWGGGENSHLASLHGADRALLRESSEAL